MAENFQDNVSYGGSTLAVSGDAIAVGSTNAGAKSIIFNNTGSQGHLAWQPTANRTINMPDLGGTVQLTGQVPGAIYDGANSITSGTIRFTNANGVSFSINGQTISGSVAAQSVQTQSLIAAVYDGANSISTGTIRFTNANGVSFSVNGQTISGSVAAQTNQTVGLYALGNTTQNSSTTLDARTLSFNGLGAATVGYSNGSIQVSVPVQTAQTQSNIQAVYDGANSISTGTIRYSNSNNFSLGINGQTVTGSFALNLSAGTTSNNRSDFVFSNANGLTFGINNGTITASAQAGAAAGIGAVQAGTQTQTSGTLIFSNSNGVTFGMSNNSVITASVAAGGGTLSLFALGNTTQNSSTSLDVRSVSFNGLGAATLGYSNGSIQVSAPNTSSLSATGAFSISVNGSTISMGVALQPAAIYDGANSISSGTIRFTNANGVSFSINGQTISGSVAAQTNQTVGLYAVGNTTQNSSTTLDARTLSFNGLGGITAGFSNGSIQMSVVPDVTFSMFNAFPNGQISSSQQTNSQMSFRYVYIDNFVSMSRLDVPIIITNASTTTANTANIVITSGAAIYTRNGSTLNPIVGITGSTTYTWASQSNWSSILGGRYASFPLATLLTPGEYWVGVHISTNNNSSIGTATTALGNTISMLIGSSYTASNFADFGVLTSASSLGLVLMQGLCSISISNTTQTFQQSQITASGLSGNRGNIHVIFRNY